MSATAKLCVSHASSPDGEEEEAEAEEQMEAAAEQRAIEAALRAIEAALRAAVSAVRGTCRRRVREYRGMVAARDREIWRLEGRLEKSEGELRLLRVPPHLRHAQGAQRAASGDTRTEFGEPVNGSDTETAEEDIAALIKEALSRSTPAPAHATEEASRDDVKPTQADDLADRLQTRTLRARVKTRSSASHSDTEDSLPSSPRAAAETPPVARRRRGRPRSSGSLASPPPDTESCSSRRQLNNDWHYHFQVPWSSLPTALSRKLDNQERPTGKERREMIRIVTAEILYVSENPCKRHLEEVARKMVLAYPKSFTDIIEGEVVGSGYDSLTRQLQYRVENCKRNTTRSKQRRPPEDGRVAARERKRRRNSYGCIQEELWPSHVEAQGKKKRGMQEMFLRDERNAERVEQWMSDTFACQRSEIRSGKGARALKEEWPYLFSLAGMKAHFRQLTGVDIDEAFEDAMTKKFGRVLDYFRASGAAGRGAQSRGGACAAVVTLLSHFKEDFGRMFHVSDGAGGVRAEHLPATPCIVACGAGPFSAAAFMVAVDHEVILEDLASFTDALIAMFVCYFVFDLPYPPDVAVTLEFLQRCIFKINPDKGSKLEVREKRRNNAVNPKVLTLITRISDFEWND